MNNLLWVKAPRPHGATSDPSGFGTLLLIVYIVAYGIYALYKYIKSRK